MREINGNDETTITCPDMPGHVHSVRTRSGENLPAFLAKLCIKEFLYGQHTLDVHHFASTAQLKAH
jgi:hypothetical protein